MCRVRRTVPFGARFVVLLAPLLALIQASAYAPASGDFAGSVDIGGGRKMYLECSGLGTPTVVLNAGLRASADDWSIAAKPGPTVSPEVAKFTRVCACDLPGTPIGEESSRSDPVAPMREMRSLICTRGLDKEAPL